MSRLFAICALVSFAVLSVLVSILLIENLPAVIAGLFGLGLAGAGGWWMITQRMPRRLVGAIGLAMGLSAVVGAVALGLDEDRRRLWMPMAIFGLAALSALTARAAVESASKKWKRAAAFPSFRPERAILICNPRSGGGKVGKFGIVQKARDLGVEVVELGPDDDLAALALQAVERGADCLGMAGGDGSQALVAGIAADHGIPFVCISAGTRNHFALDLGLDRNDPVDGLRAFTDGVLRRVDYAEVGSRVFLNNVSLGVYAAVVEERGYREAKLATFGEVLPQLLGSQAQAFDLQFTNVEGEQVEGSWLILVSNNPYVVEPAPDIWQRRSLDAGQLGILAIRARTAADAAAVLTDLTVGLQDLKANVHRFTAESFEVRSGASQVPAGVDGEALVLDAPLLFTLHPGGLSLLVPADNPTSTATRHFRSVGLRGLWAIALGRDPQRKLVGGVSGHPAG